MAKAPKGIFFVVAQIYLFRINFTAPGMNGRILQTRFSFLSTNARHFAPDLDGEVCLRAWSFSCESKSSHAQSHTPVWPAHQCSTQKHTPVQHRQAHNQCSTHKHNQWTLHKPVQQLITGIQQTAQKHTGNQCCTIAINHPALLLMMFNFFWPLQSMFRISKCDIWT